MQNKWVIIGCGGHARSIADVILYNDENADIIFLDKNAKEGEILLGFPVKSEYKITNENVIVGIGNNSERVQLSKKYYDNLVNVISKNAYVSKTAKLGKGVFIAHKAHVGVLSQIGDFVIVNTSAAVDHECLLKRGSFIGPNSTLCGNVEVGENCFIGAGVSIIPNVKICSNSVIGAGTNVIKNIDISGMYVGNPARGINEE